MNLTLEKMNAFFDCRVDGYDEHMLDEVEGCRNGYQKLAELLPSNIESILDLGCGTGLELEPVFVRFPSVAVTGIDLSEKMLERLKEKYKGKTIDTIQGSYFGRTFGESIYDAVISFQTMHHMSHKDKQSVYQNIYRALKEGGVYIECDYMLTDPAEEQRLYADNERLRRTQNIPDGEFYHFDTPCTIDNQLALLKKAGFCNVSDHWREGNTTIITGKK